ncbi:MAG TPA: ABC-2 family transporter protein [Gaiellales bacterium]|nr:ABC-2 family transporter protein [Gaiellales bacterium]
MSPYLAGWRLGFLRTLRSPGDLSVRIGFFAAILLVMSALWGTAIDANGGELEGYTRSSLLWYVFAAQTAVLGVRPRSVEEIGDEIGGGTIAIQMLRPVSVVGLRMSIDLGEACARMAAAFVAGAALTWLFAGPPPSATALAMAAPAIVLAAAANIASSHAFGGVAFWLLDAKSTWFLYQKLVFLPGGMLIPLDILPRPLEVVSLLLPFATMAYAPGRIASGDTNPLLLVWQMGWLAALIVLAAGVFAAGQRRLQVLGG